MPFFSPFSEKSHAFSEESLDFIHSTHVKISYYHSIVPDIYDKFDQHPTLQLRANFLDISKAFDRLWHKGLLFKHGHNRISGNLKST